MEQHGIFAFLLKTLITIWLWLWVFLAITLCGAFVGLMVNLAINQKEFYPIVIYGFTAIGFIAGLYKAESLRRKRALADHMAALMATPEIDGKK